MAKGQVRGNKEPKKPKQPPKTPPIPVSGSAPSKRGASSELKRK
jgi:hypothetical protein